MKRAQRLAPHDRLGAAASDPSAQPAVGGDDRLVAGPRGGRRLAPNDRGQHARRAGRGELAELVEDVVRYSLTPAARSAAQTLSGVTGMSMFFTPYGDSASITAFT